MDPQALISPDESPVAGQDDAAPPAKLHEQVYREIRGRIMTGQVVPGRGMTLRKLAGELGVSPMPVRDAVSRLVAERALTLGQNRRILVPEMTPGRFQEIVAARRALEPEAARRALGHVDKRTLRRMREIDETLDNALKSGDVEGYITANFGFHFTLYNAAPSDVLVPLVESLWLQFSPFMRVAYGLVGTKTLVDYHQQALAAIEQGDAEGLVLAIRNDIDDGMALIGTSVVDP